MQESSHLYMISTLIYLLLLFAAAIISVLGSIFIFGFLTRSSIKEKEEIVQNRNIGFAMILASFIWTIGCMCFETINPIMNAWYGTVDTGLSAKVAIIFILGVLASLLIALVSGALAVFLAVQLLMTITKEIDKWEEIKHGNVAVAIVISVTVLLMGVFFKSIISYVIMSLFKSLI